MSCSSPRRSGMVVVESFSINVLNYRSLLFLPSFQESLKDVQYRFRQKFEKITRYRFRFQKVPQYFFQCLHCLGCCFCFLIVFSQLGLLVYTLRLRKRPTFTTCYNLWSPYVIGRPYIFSCCGLFFFFFLLMAALCNRGAIIFLPCSFFLLLSFYLSIFFFLA